LLSSRLRAAGKDHAPKLLPGNFGQMERLPAQKD